MSKAAGQSELGACRATSEREKDLAEPIRILCV